MRGNYKTRLKELRAVIEYNRCHSQTLSEFQYYCSLEDKVDLHIDDIKKFIKEHTE